ncbi:MAG: hypothetical protein AB7T49_17555 [Oligoflexales bacterium]
MKIGVLVAALTLAALACGRKENGSKLAAAERKDIEQELYDSMLALENKETTCEWKTPENGDFTIPTKIVLDDKHPETREFFFRFVSVNDPETASGVLVLHRPVDFRIPPLERSVSVADNVETVLIDYTFTGYFYDNVQIIKTTNLSSNKRTLKIEFRKILHTNGNPIGAIICDAVAVQ